MIIRAFKVLFFLPFLIICGILIIISPLIYIAIGDSSYYLDSFIDWYERL